MGPSWGHVGLQNRLGRVQEAKKDATEKNIQKHKPVNAWNGKRACIVDPEGDLRTCVCARVCMNLFIRPC